MEQIQKATLTLRTTSLPLNAANVKGSVDQFRTNMTWNNINLRLLLGDMYDRFDNFNLKLAFVSSDDDRTWNGVGTGFNGTGFINFAGEFNSDQIVTFNLSGLNLLNNTYDSDTNNIGSSVVIATYKFYESFSKEFNNSIVTFTKGNEMCNLNIKYLDVYTNTIPATYSAFPHMTFVFHIYGIPRDTKKH